MTKTDKISKAYASGLIETVLEEEKRKMNDTFPVLYILVRTDLDSLNPGKLGAQTSHASNAFLHQWKRLCENMDDAGANYTGFEPIVNTHELINDWQNQTNQGFGTVLTLAATMSQMQFTVGAAERGGLLSGMVMDDTYPILVARELGEFLKATYPDGLVVGDGGRYVTIPLEACAYVFADKNDPYTSMLLGGYKLHP